MLFGYRLLLFAALLLSVATVRVINRQTQPTAHEQIKALPQTSPVNSPITPAPSKVTKHKSLGLKEKDKNEQQEDRSQDSSVASSSSEDSDGVPILSGLAKQKQLKQRPVSKKQGNMRFNRKKGIQQFTEKTKDSKADDSEAIDTFSTFSIIVIYVTSFIAVLLMLKQFNYPQESTLQVVILTATKLRSYLRFKREGYKAPEFNQETNEQNVENKVYHGKEFFWEKDTTVEGI